MVARCISYSLFRSASRKPQANTSLDKHAKRGIGIKAASDLTAIGAGTKLVRPTMG